ALMALEAAGTLGAKDLMWFPSASFPSQKGAIDLMQQGVLHHIEGSMKSLPRSAMRAEYAHAAHIPLRTVVTQRAIHRALDVVEDALLHQVNGAFLGRKGR